MEASINPIELLQFYIDSGVDELIEDAPLDRFKVTENSSAQMMSFAPTQAAAPKSGGNLKPLPTINAPAQPAPLIGTIEALKEAKAVAAKAQNLDELKAALQKFNGISLSRTATQMIFAEGVLESKIMIIGDTPNADEDRAGRPFAGERGELFDKMFAAIGLNRDESIYITNLINWYPPGNRLPSENEIALCLPFAQRHIELAKPELLIFIGDIPTKALLQTRQSVTRLHGKWVDYKTENMEHSIPTMPIFRPDYLLASPAQKGKAWADLLKIKAKIKELKELESL